MPPEEFNKLKNEVKESVMEEVSINKEEVTLPQLGTIIDRIFLQIDEDVSISTNTITVNISGTTSDGATFSDTDDIDVLKNPDNMLLISLKGQKHKIPLYDI